mgnify:CR=1 FL=1
MAIAVTLGLANAGIFYKWSNIAHLSLAATVWVLMLVGFVAAEMLLQRRAETLQVVFGGAEEQHEAQVGMDQLPCQFLRHQFDIAGAGHGGDDAVGHFLLHSLPRA